MANLHSQATYDASLSLKAAGLVAASANGATIVDIGNGFVDADMIVDVSAIETDSSDESYTVILEGSSDSDFGTAGNIVALARTVFGHSSAAAMAPQGSTSAVGRYVVPFRNELNGSMYRYLRLRTVVAGTIATGINYAAFISKDVD